MSKSFMTTGFMLLLITVAANITSYSSSQVVTSPSVALVTCEASGLPRPSINWTDPDGNTLVSGSNVIVTEADIGTRELRSTLRLFMTATSRSGIYNCVAYNGVTSRGAISSAPILLTVHGKIY